MKIKYITIRNINGYYFKLRYNIIIGIIFFKCPPISFPKIFVRIIVDILLYMQTEFWGSVSLFSLFFGLRESLKEIKMKVRV